MTDITKLASWKRTLINAERRLDKMTVEEVTGGEDYKDRKVIQPSPNLLALEISKIKEEMKDLEKQIIKESDIE